MIIEYDNQMLFTKSVEIEDIGNVAIRATNENGLDFYLLTRTIMGKTTILRFGPVLADTSTLLDSFETSFQKINFKEPQIKKIISMYINESKKKITEINLISANELLESFPNISDAVFED